MPNCPPSMHCLFGSLFSVTLVFICLLSICNVVLFFQLILLHLSALFMILSIKANLCFFISSVTTWNSTLKEFKRHEKVMGQRRQSLMDGVKYYLTDFFRSKRGGGFRPQIFSTKYIFCKGGDGSPTIPPLCLDKNIIHQTVFDTYLILI